MNNNEITKAHIYIYSASNYTYIKINKPRKNEYKSLKRPTIYLNIWLDYFIAFSSLLIFSQ